MGGRADEWYRWVEGLMNGIGGRTDRWNKCYNQLTCNHFPKKDLFSISAYCPGEIISLHASTHLKGWMSSFLGFIGIS